MIDIKDLTLKELVTRRPDLIQAIKNGEDKGTVTSLVINDKEGRMKTWTEENRDIDGVLISKRVDDYTYYETGEIDTTTQQNYDSQGDLTSEIKIKHFKDGKRPEVTVLSKI